MTLQQIMLVSKLVKRQLRLENDLHIDIELCVDIAPLLSQFDESDRVDRLTCSRCDRLRNNILKQLLEIQLSHAINPLHVVGREVVIRTCV